MHAPALAQNSQVEDTGRLRSLRGVLQLKDIFHPVAIDTDYQVMLVSDAPIFHVLESQCGRLKDQGTDERNRLEQGVDRRAPAVEPRSRRRA